VRNSSARGFFCFWLAKHSSIANPVFAQNQFLRRKVVSGVPGYGLLAGRYGPAPLYFGDTTLAGEEAGCCGHIFKLFEYFGHSGFKFPSTHHF
jgi:hypothetical protein